MAVSPELLESIKSSLNITWDDEGTDSKISGIIERGIAYLNGKRGAPADYMTPGTPQELLFEYCRYARDEALDVFENNYLHRLLALQNERQVAEYAQKAIQTNE